MRLENKSEKSKQTLISFFKITTAGFQFTNAVQEATGGKAVVSNMQKLHEWVLVELQKEVVDWETVDVLLERMEQEAYLNKIVSEQKGD